MRRILLVVLLAAAAAARVPVVSADGAWLDEDPPAQWNRPGMALPTTEALESAGPSGLSCRSQARPPETDEDQAVLDAGWFLMGGYAAGWGVRVVGGNGGYDGMCRPVGYQYFVFVDGVFAGTLSPRIMNSRFDGAGGAPEIQGADLVRAEFARYTPADPFCCPSGSSAAFYRIERTDSGPVVLLFSVVSRNESPR